MNVALLVNQVGPDPTVNLARIVAMVYQACDQGARLIVLPEAAHTGLVNCDDPMYDLPQGQPVPGPLTKALGRLCLRCAVWLECGVLEREDDRLYDTALLIASDGQIHLKYRRIQPHWHGRTADPLVYGQGEQIPVTETPFGRIACLICGDLFDDSVVSRVYTIKPDWLLWPNARCFSDGSHDQMRWDRDEMPIIRERVALAGCTTLMTNYLAGLEVNGGGFGGAEVIAGDGRRLAHYPLGTPGMLVVEMDDIRKLAVQ